MSTATETLDDALIGRRIAAIDARQLGDVAELKAVTFDDGTKLHFSWHVGTSHERVGARVEHPRKPLA